MGVIRLLLALAVVSGHSGTFFGVALIPAPLAVQAFYIISGFYISLVLGRKYSLNRSGIFHFYINRYLRLAPGYWTVLIISIILATIVNRTIYLPWGEFLNSIRSLSGISSFWVIFTNLTMLGQDTMMFLNHQLGSDQLAWTANFQATEFPAYKLLLIPQGWSLGIELWFYILAPFLIPRNTFFIIFLCLLTFLLRIYLANTGFNDDPWTYRFFPSELGLFLVGISLNRFYFLFRESFSQKIGKGLFFGIILLIVLFEMGTIDPVVKNWIFLVIFAASLPLIFHWSRNIHVDRMIGELSYPVYTCHLLFSPFFGRFHFFAGPLTAICSLIFSYCIYRFIDQPVDRFRESLRE